MTGKSFFFLMINYPFNMKSENEPLDICKDIESKFMNLISLLLEIF